MELRFELLQRRHDRSEFQCGIAALHNWFRTRAGQDQQRRVAQVFVAMDDEGIAGFYCLSMFSLALDSIPPQHSWKLPRYDQIPAALIGRLARHRRTAGTGLGDLLLVDAMTRVLGAADSVGTYAIVVDSKDERGRTFYQRHGFIPLPSRPQRLFLPTQVAAAAYKAATPK